jgi:hypothetical protein
MIKTQVQIPDRIFERAEKVAAAREWSFAEMVRRGLEQMVLNHPKEAPTTSGRWRLPDPVDPGREADPLTEPDWREKTGLTSGAGRLMAERWRARALR